MLCNATTMKSHKIKCPEYGITLRLHFSNAYHLGMFWFVFRQNANFNAQTVRLFLGPEPEYFGHKGLQIGYLCTKHYRSRVLQNK